MTAILRNVDDSHAVLLEQLLSTDPHLLAEREQHAFDTLLAQHSGRIVLFGMGGLGRHVLRNLLKHGITPLALCDTNEKLWGSEIESIAVLSPQELALQFGDNASVMITIYHSAFSNVMDCAFNALAEKLRALGCQTIIPFVPLFWKYAEEMLPYLRLDLPSRLLAEQEKIREVYALLGDNRSRQEFVQQIKRALTADLEDWPEIPIEEAYFPAHILSISSTESFIDAGAYTGDTLALFIARTHGKFNQITCLEPDPDNFAKMQSYTATLPAELQSRIHLYPQGVWKRKDRLAFETSGTMGSSISQSGTQIIEVIAIDDLPRDLNPTYIKMDIEGAELDALDGAAATIQRCAPKLAICNNHAQHHLWEVPLKMHALNPHYRLYLRRDYPDDVDLICYAVTII